MIKLYNIIFLLIISSGLYAQITITGNIISAEDNYPLPGATILVKGSTIGTITDIDGNYSIQVEDPNAILVFSFVGLASKEELINGRKIINVALKQETLQVEEVVVTAIGIKRSEKSLGYSSAKVDAEEISKSGTSSVMNSLQGKVPGLVISGSSGAPGASTKVVIRGYNSLSGSNQPLYVIDGIPMNNSTNNIAVGGNLTGNVKDFGNQGNDINPEDIENITVLKGASATALYGSRAANGVIMITTKNANNSKKINIEYTGSITLSEAGRLPEMQNTFGQGWYGLFSTEENGSWGPMMDGSIRPFGNEVDGEQLTRPYVSHPDNLRNFFTVGKRYNNALSVSGSRKNLTAYLSYSNDFEDGIVPTASDSYGRNTLSLKNSYKLKKTTFTSSINYLNKKARAMSTGQGDASAGLSVYRELLAIPRSINLNDIKDYKNKFNNIDNYFTPYADNPYFIINENGNLWDEDRYFGNIGIETELTPWLSVSWKTGLDYSEAMLEDYAAKAMSNPGSINSNKQRSDIIGRYEESMYYNYQLNNDLLFSLKNKINDNIKINSWLGLNTNETSQHKNIAYISGLKEDKIYNLSNSEFSPIQFKSDKRKRIMGVYEQSEIAYKEQLFLTLSLRNDWSSSLPEKNNSYFYPGFTISYLLSDAFPGLKKSLPFAKVRGGWGMTGNDASPYVVNSEFTRSEINLIYHSLTFPIDSMEAFEVGNRLGNNLLRPEMTEEIEFGLDLRFWKNRFGLDGAVYRKISRGQILNVPISTSSGYTSQTMNLGDIENKGIELMVYIKPIQTRNFLWNININYTKNINEVISLPNELQKIELVKVGDVSMVAKPNRPMGIIEGPVPLRNSSGQIIVDENGIPKTAAANEEYGTIHPDFIMALSQQFSYKGFSLNTLLDFRKGGLLYSYTSVFNTFTGNSIQTAYNNRQAFIVPNSVQEFLDADGKPYYKENTQAIEPENIWTYYYTTTNKSSIRNHILDRTYLKLREVSLSYDLPSGWINRIKMRHISFGIVGRNLFLWTPSGNTVIDPETSTFGNDIAGEFGEYGGGPSIRSIGLQIKASY